MSEYRVRNIVQVLNEPFEVAAVGLSGVITLLNAKGVQVPISYAVKPVELTHEWLIALGFEFKEKEQYFNHPSFKIEIKRLKKGFVICQILAGFRFDKHYFDLEYVHQLQNIVFEITRGDVWLEV